LPPPPAPLLRHERSIPLPPHLAAEVRKAKDSSLAGLLPRAGLAWTARDSRLFLWSYGGGGGGGVEGAGAGDGGASSWGATRRPRALGGREDCCSFSVPSGSPVASVGLVRPRPGVFASDVEWCVVVATPSEVILCALAREELRGDDGGGVREGLRRGDDSVLRLVPTRFVVPADRVPVASVCGTEAGRIFLGGVDGNLYEMTYEGRRRPSGGERPLGPAGGAATERAIDEYFDGRGGSAALDALSGASHGSTAKRIASGGKRAFSALTFGSLDDDGCGGSGRSRKCRRINHTSSPSGWFLPAALARVASDAFLGSGAEHVARRGGPIVSVVVDEERTCLYTLGAEGVICTYDLSPSSPNPNPNARPVSDAPPRLASAVDAPAAARLYLDAVSRGRFSPPSTSHDLALGTIAFPGGVAGAQAGVGGMEGARDVLKRHDREVRAKAAAAKETRNGRKSGNDVWGVLAPRSIHLVPPSQSKSLTLVAITGGGLRYYLSSLSSSSSPSGYGVRGVGTDRPKLGRRTILCHIRSPPPYATTAGEGNDGLKLEAAPSAVELFSSSRGRGLPPGIHDVSGRLGEVRGCYEDGALVLAVDVDGGRSRGDAVVACLQDFAAQETGSADGLANNTLVAAGGMSEVVVLPASGLGGSPSPVLPGGFTDDVVLVAGGCGASHITDMIVHSETPSDAELRAGPPSPYVPRGTTKSKPLTSIVTATPHGTSVVSSALSLLSHYLRDGRGLGREVGTVSDGSVNGGRGPSVAYRLSRRHGCNAGGFVALAAAGRAAVPSRPGPGVTTRAARLPPRLLRPPPAPLGAWALQHLAPPGGGGSGDVLILNAGGLHLFSRSSLLNEFAAALLRAADVARDSSVEGFFRRYGCVEGCAMSFALAASGASSRALRERAVQAAMCNAHQRVMKLNAPASQGDGLNPLSSYVLRPSSLYEGLVQHASRLLRPFWHKPAAVVTEGRPLHARGAFANYYASLPAKVELLLDEVMCDELRRPLELLRNLMRKTFGRAVECVPGAPGDAGDAMDVDEARGGLGAGGDGGLITQALRNQARGDDLHLPGRPAGATAQELRDAARAREERNLHSLYRLLSRIVQCLDLMSCLVRAHCVPSLPEVQWGFLHGMTFCQLVTTREGQWRVEAILSSCLNALTSGGADADHLVETLSKQCYLFFSPASRLSRDGFRAAEEALSHPANSPRRGLLATRAAACLRAAARSWHSPELVAGIPSPSSGNTVAVGWEEVAARALEAGSPLARAANVLLQLGDARGLADVCLICASNFGGARVPRQHQQELGLEEMQEILRWERGLYHGPSKATTRTRTMSDVLGSDALLACHSIIFYHVSQLLAKAGSSASNDQQLAEELVAACAASADIKFLYALYEHLLATNNVDTAIRIDSSSLEDWLRVEKRDVGLLWRYYSFHGRDVLAGDIMLRAATGEGDRLPLEQRIEFLTRAADSYSLAMRSGLDRDALNIRSVSTTSGQGTREYSQKEYVPMEMLQGRVKQIKEQLDVAAIQERVLTTVIQSQNVDLDSAKLEKLSFSLVNVTDLYNDYAAALGLFDLCLIIMQTCHHRHPDETGALWRNLIWEEILPCATDLDSVAGCLERLRDGDFIEGAIARSTTAGGALRFEDGGWIPHLCGRVVALGRELIGKGADFTFPLDLIVRELEGETELKCLGG
ncbi:hypothetical protein ACHAWF_010137, partial [Thalassiosira exigua]